MAPTMVKRSKRTKATTFIFSKDLDNPLHLLPFSGKGVSRSVPGSPVTKATPSPELSPVLPAAGAGPTVESFDPNPLQPLHFENYIGSTAVPNIDWSLFDDQPRRRKVRNTPKPLEEQLSPTVITEQVRLTELLCFILLMVNSTRTRRRYLPPLQITNKHQLLRPRSVYFRHATTTVQEDFLSHAGHNQHIQLGCPIHPLNRLPDTILECRTLHLTDMGTPTTGPSIKVSTVNRRTMHHFLARLLDRDMTHQVLVVVRLT